MSNGRVRFEARLRSFCLRQVLLIGVLTVIALMVKMWWMPGTPLPALTIYMLCSYFFIISLVNLAFDSFRGVRLPNFLIFGLPLVLSLAGACLLPSSTNSLTALFTLCLAVGEWGASLWMYRISSHE